MPASLRLRCRACRTDLRVPVRAACAVYGCPRCRSEFEAEWRDRAFHIEWRPVAPPPAADDAPMTESLARQILSVGPGADAPAIKRAWRRASQHYHPDKHGRLPERLQQAAEREIKRINAAYDFLARARASASG
ncbi:MAG: J domain-containing protein [Burkholderiaceae bacterium]